MAANVKLVCYKWFGLITISSKILPHHLPCRASVSVSSCLISSPWYQSQVFQTRNSRDPLEIARIVCDLPWPISSIWYENFTMSKFQSKCLKTSNIYVLFHILYWKCFSKIDILRFIFPFAPIVAEKGREMQVSGQWLAETCSFWLV